MTREVIIPPPQLSFEEVRGALPVRGSTQWKPLAQNANHLLGKGGQLVGAGPWQTQISPGGSETFHYHIWTRQENTERVWLITLAPLQNSFGYVSAGSASGTIFGGGEARTTEWIMPRRQSTDGAILVTHQVTIVVGSSTPTGTLLIVTNDSSSEIPIQVQAINSFEVPRRFLQSAEGARESTDLSPHSIWEGGDNSVEGVGVHAIAAKNKCRRNNHFSWFNADGVTNATEVFAEILITPTPMLARHQRNKTVGGLSSVLGKIDWAVFAKVSSGTATIRATATSGNVTTVSVNSAVTAWYISSDFEIDTEHMSRIPTDGGIRDGTRDYITFEGKNDGAAQTLTIFGICAGEDLQP